MTVTYSDSPLGSPSIDVSLLLGNGLVDILDNVKVFLGGGLVQITEEGRGRGSVRTTTSRSSSTSFMITASVEAFGTSHWTTTDQDEESEAGDRFHFK